jgi:predicted dehydrogenase
MKPINVALIGCGKFVHDMHLANLRSHERFHIHCTVDVRADAAREVAEESGAEYWTGDAGRAFADPAVDLAFITTTHDTHARLAVQAARSGKHIFCEKPMALNDGDCAAVAAAVAQSGVVYASGFNRTFAPFTRAAREALAPLHAPMLIYHRFADWNPYNHGWLIDEKRSGGRVLGEGGHSLDMMCRLTGHSPVRLYAEGGNLAEPSPTLAPDSALITAGFPDGSSGVLYLSSVANNGFPKEEVQITCANHTIVIVNFQRMTIYAPDGQKELALPAGDKGHMAELDAIARSIQEGTPMPNGVAEAWRTARLTFAAVRSIRSHTLQQV